jgi:hypothetical protein
MRVCASSASASACVNRPPLARRFNPYDFEAAPSISVESTSSAAAFPTSRLQAACSWAARKQMVMKQVLLVLQRMPDASLALHAADVVAAQSGVQHAWLELVSTAFLPGFAQQARKSMGIRLPHKEGACQALLDFMCLSVCCKIDGANKRTRGPRSALQMRQDPREAWLIAQKWPSTAPVQPHPRGKEPRNFMPPTVAEVAAVYKCVVQLWFRLACMQPSCRHHPAGTRGTPHSAVSAMSLSTTGCRVQCVRHFAGAAACAMPQALGRGWRLDIWSP